MAETKIDIKKVNELQEKLNTLIDESFELLCQLNGIKTNQNEIENIVKMDPLKFDLYLCNDFFNDETDMFDPDASLVAWKYYKNYYKDFFVFPKISEKSKMLWTSGNEYKRYCITFDYKNDNNSNKKPSVSDTIFLTSGKNIGISGDSCFNFNKIKIRKFIHILSDIKQEKDYSQINNLVLQCFKMHHSPLNFALMPHNGGMNNVKGDGKQGLDRFDMFLSALKFYFENKENPVAIKLIAEFETSQNSLLPFLKSIETFENYLELFYPELLTKNKNKNSLCKKLIESGKESINSEDRVIEYIELAIRFWEAKLDYYNKQNQLQKS